MNETPFKHFWYIYIKLALFLLKKKINFKNLFFKIANQKKKKIVKSFESIIST